jgi:hypothetical protein
MFGPPCVPERSEAIAARGVRGRGSVPTTISAWTARSAYSPFGQKGIRMSRPASATNFTGGSSLR